jgi:predicted ribonuclease YlaK
MGGISVDAVNGIVLSIDQLPGEDAEQLKAWLEPILDAMDADGLVSDVQIIRLNLTDSVRSTKNLEK